MKEFSKMENYKDKERLFTRMESFLKEFFKMEDRQMGLDSVLMENLSLWMKWIECFYELKQK